MNSADWVILAIVSGSALISLVRGFVREALSLLQTVPEPVEQDLTTENQIH